MSISDKEFTMDSQIVLAVSFALYNLFIIGFGLYSTKLKKETSEDFVLANRELGPWAAALSASASSESGWVMLGLVGMAFIEGASAFWIVPGIGLGYIFNWYYLAEKLRVATAENGAVTIPQYINFRFGKNSKSLKLVSSIIIIIAMLGYVAAQMNAAGKAFDATFSLPYWLGVVIGAGIILTYTIFGGFRAVCWTDIIQSSFMFIALLVMPFVILFQLGGFGNFIEMIRNSNPDFLSITAGKTGFTLIGFIVGFLGIGLGYPGQPHILARFMAAKDKATISKGSLIALSWMTIVYVGAIFFGMFAKAYFGTVADPEQALPLAVNELLTPALGGFVIAAIISAICSTADSQLIVISTIFSRDILPMFRSKNMSDLKKIIFLDKIVLIVLAVISVFFALTENRVIFDFVLYAWSVLGASFGPVVILGLVWKRATKAGALSGMITGLVVSVVWRDVAVLKNLVYELVPAFIFAFIAVVVVSLMTSDDSSK